MRTVTLEELGEIFLRFSGRIEVEVEKALHMEGEKMVQTAEGYLGDLGWSGKGGHPQWAPLTADTMRQRLKLGFPENEPLLRTGEMRDSIAFSATGTHGELGSSSRYAPVHELGSAKNNTPPRPFLGPAAFHHEQPLAERIAEALSASLAGTY